MMPVSFTVEQLVVVMALQRDAPAAGDPEGQDRAEEDRHAHEVGDLVDHAGYCWMPLDKAIEEVWSWTNKEALQDLRTEL